MYYEIRRWNKVEAGKYESDQKTFDYAEAKYIALYRVEKSFETWDVYKSVLKNKDNEDEGRIYMPVAPSQKTLKEAKEVAEKLFGIRYRVDDIDLA